MLIITILILLTGVFMFFNTSKRAILGHSRLEKLLQKHPVAGKSIASVLVLTSFVLFVAIFGFAAGLFYALVASMTVLCLQVLLAPLIKMLSKN